MKDVLITMLKHCLKNNLHAYKKIVTFIIRLPKKKLPFKSNRAELSMY